MALVEIIRASSGNAPFRSGCPSSGGARYGPDASDGPDASVHGSSSQGTGPAMKGGQKLGIGGLVKSDPMPLGFADWAAHGSSVGFGLRPTFHSTASAVGDGLFPHDPRRTLVLKNSGLARQGTSMGATLAVPRNACNASDGLHCVRYGSVSLADWKAVEPPAKRARVLEDDVDGDHLVVGAARDVGAISESAMEVKSMPVSSVSAGQVLEQRPGDPVAGLGPPLEVTAAAPESASLSSTSSATPPAPTFPMVLWEMITKADTSVIDWCSQGSQFRVIDEFRLVHYVLPKWFKSYSMAGFLSELAAFGFQLCPWHSYRPTYMHPHFHQRQRHLLNAVVRLPVYVPVSTTVEDGSSASGTSAPVIHPVARQLLAERAQKLQRARGTNTTNTTQLGDGMSGSSLAAHTDPRPMQPLSQLAGGTAASPGSETLVRIPDQTHWHASDVDVTQVCLYPLPSSSLPIHLHPLTHSPTHPPTHSHTTGHWFGPG